MSKDAFRVICSLKQAYFNRSLAVYYSAKVGEEIRTGSPVLRLADKDGSVVINASPQHCYKADHHATWEIKGSNIELCEIWETDAEFHQEIEEDRIETKEEDEIQDDEPSIEDKLKELKRLYTKKLISKSVYEEKQRQIMSDF